MSRGSDSAGRARQMHCVSTALDPNFPWLKRPIRNWNTRLVMVADAREGRLVAQGYEVTATTGPATAPLELTA